MSHDRPIARGSFEQPGTVQTRADGLRVSDRIFVRHDDEDLWALITAIKPTEDSGTLRLDLRVEVDGAPIQTFPHTALLNRSYLRTLPSSRSAGVTRRTTEYGLAAAGALYRTDWDTEGTVNVHLPIRIACQILGDRGWHHVHNPDSSHFAWTAPNGERFWETGEAVRVALTAEGVDPTAASLGATRTRRH